MSTRIYPSARERILDAVERLVLKNGAGHLTLDAVAQASKISKGGLMHHFHSKEELLMGLMQRLHDNWIDAIEEWRGEFAPGPIGLARAMLKFCFKSEAGRQERPRRIFSALSAGQAYQPQLLDFARRTYAGYLKEFKKEAGKTGACLAVMTALDGVWWSRVNGLYQLSAAEEKALHATLEAMLSRAEKTVPARK